MDNIKTYCINWQPMFHALHIVRPLPIPRSQCSKTWKVFGGKNCWSLLLGSKHHPIYTICHSVPIPLSGDLPEVLVFLVDAYFNSYSVTRCSELKAHRQGRSPRMLILYSLFLHMCVIWEPVTILEAFKGQLEHMQQWILHDRCQLREMQFRCKIVSAALYPLNASRVCLQFVPFNFFVVESTRAFHLVLYRKLWLFCIL